MRFYKQPSTAMPVSFMDVLLSLLLSFGSDKRNVFADKLKALTGKKHIFLANKGTSVFYLFLKVLKSKSDKCEIILPAYTVTTLTQAITKLGLKVRLVDVDPNTLNFDLKLLSQVLNKNTLAVVPVYHFGFIRPLEEVKNITGDIPLIEDICQCWGSEPKSSDISDASFWSLCRGKSFSTYQGGVIGINDDSMADAFKKELDLIPEPSFSYNLKQRVILILYALAMHPFFYNLMYRSISRFKSTHIHHDFPLFKYPKALAPFGLRMLKKFKYIRDRRIMTGTTLYNALKGNKNFIIPDIYPSTICTFNHLPMVFFDPKKRQEAENLLSALNIDSGRMYLKPLHMIFDIGYEKNPELFPNAKMVADGLLTIPAHPYLRTKDINNIINALQRIK